MYNVFLTSANVVVKYIYEFYRYLLTLYHVLGSGEVTGIVERATNKAPDMEPALKCGDRPLLRI